MFSSFYFRYKLQTNVETWGLKIAELDSFLNCPVSGLVASCLVLCA